MREEIERRQEFARDLVKVSDSSATYGFLEKYGEEGIDKVEEIINSKQRSHVKSEGYEETVVFNFLDNIGLLDKFNDKHYRPDTDIQNLELFREQLKEDTDPEYGRQELLAYLQVYGEGLSNVAGEERAPTTEYFREIEESGFEKPPTEQPYKDKFGSFSWALHVAGFESRDEITEEMLEQDLRKAVFRKNEDNDELIETLSAREIEDSDMLRSATNYRQRFGSIEKAYKEAHLSEVRSIESDLNDWHILTRYIPEIEEKSEREYTGIYPETDFS